MIPRYSRPEMVAIWSPETRFRIWFEIEAHAADAMAELGIIPKSAAQTIWAKAKDAVFNVERIDEIERTTRGLVVRDVGSLNGTYLNQVIVEGDTPMANGDELQVGRFKLVYVAGTEG